MEYLTPYLAALAIGLVYFGIVMFLVKKFNFKYTYGLVLPLALVVFFAVMTFIGGQMDTTGWQALGYLVMTILSGVVLIGYVLGWVGVILTKKKA